MVGYLCVGLLAVLALVASELISLNQVIDKNLWRVRDAIRREGATYYPIPPGRLSQVTFSKGTWYGRDSIVRTGDCTLLKSGTSSSFDLHFGYTLLLLAFGRLDVAGDAMAASARIRDNSFQISFTVDRGGDSCRLRLEKARLERLKDVEVAASRPEYDGVDAEDFFGTEVLNALNGVLRSWQGKMETAMQKYFCGRAEEDTVMAITVLLAGPNDL